jgi:hypothetical protein
MADQRRILRAYHRLLLAIMLLWLGYSFVGTALSLVIHIPEALWGAIGLLFFVISGYFAFHYVVTKHIIAPGDPTLKRAIKSSPHELDGR